ncbi:hypothetical protein Zm00014a_034915 [Zea mays]|jgi:hypothetical protein|uniref:Uncharacterized protein n=2 Tax=Zea mays TaxID=4577 RepID=C0PL96_MAIZE|nr:uncharacterized protein LOC100384067 [Zea mays]XP_035820184.1 uncharacterized protein LOC109943519 [Zea mays]ACN35962.1 unknown [Zea mays]ONM06605.1 hypothetical protein ZEAMMB73_Zm00001d033015 [Zea mays]PWZ57256.1 hypothetical protein Zm00014a_034915 [Zea mays]|eukprot:NP_001170140.1 uncharacterized protein LOC100384067 [Zea mays]
MDREGSAHPRNKQMRACSVRWVSDWSRARLRNGQRPSWGTAAPERTRREMNAARELRELGQAVRKEEGQRPGELLGKEELGREMRAMELGAVGRASRGRSWRVFDGKSGGRRWASERRAQGRAGVRELDAARARLAGRAGRWARAGAGATRAKDRAPLDAASRAEPGTAEGRLLASSKAMADELRWVKRRAFTAKWRSSPCQGNRDQGQAPYGRDQGRAPR